MNVTDAESSEEALIEMYLAGCRYGGRGYYGSLMSKVSPATISELNKKAYVHIEDWRTVHCRAEISVCLCGVPAPQLGR